MTSSLRLIDGGLNDPHSSRLTISVSNRVETAGAIRELLARLRPELLVDIDYTDQEGVFRDRDNARLSAIKFSSRAAVATTSISWTSRVCAMPATFRAMSKNLDLDFIATCGESKASLIDACKLSKLAGRKAPCIVSDDSDGDFALQVRDDIDAVFTSTSGAPFLSVPETISILVRDKLKCDLIIAPGDVAEFLETMAAELAGVGPIRARCWRHEEGISTAGISASIAGETPISVAADLHALSAYLAAIGWHQSAACVLNALVKTLEDNLHTAAMPVLMPYGRCVSDIEFVGAVAARLGELPRRIPAVGFHPEESAPVSHSAHTRLSLVHPV